MMDGIKNGVGVVGGGGGRVGVGVAAIVEEDMGDGMQCVNHPYRNNPGGICAFCLQEKLGKLVSSSFPLPIRPSSSSASSPPSFRSETAVISAVRGGNDGGIGSGGGGGGGIVTSSASSLSVVRPGNGHYEECYTRKARIPFLLAKKKKKIMVASSSSSDHHNHHHHHHHHGGGNIAFKRSKSTSAPIRGRFMDGSVGGGDFSPRKRNGFWSFLYLSSKTHTSKKVDKVSSSNSSIAPPPATTTVATTAGGGVGGGGASSSSSGSIVKHKEKSLVIIEDDDSSNNEATPSAASSSFERKVSRSRSVGCGSRSFSGDFFERISTGFGDCTLRRVESQREGKPKSSSHSHSHSASAANVAASTMKERVKCGGIFGGFIITSSSSSSSSSSYWLSSSAEDHHHHHVNGRSTKSWGWAFASPMRAFTKPSSGKKDATTVIRESNNKNSTTTATTTTTPNLAAIPSLLTVRV